MIGAQGVGLCYLPTRTLGFRVLCFGSGVWGLGFKVSVLCWYNSYWLKLVAYFTSEGAGCTVQGLSLAKLEAPRLLCCFSYWVQGARAF